VILLFLLALPILFFVALVGLVVFLVTLPFRLLGFAFHLVAALLALPLLPLVLLVLGTVWAVKRMNRRPAVA